MRFKVDLTMIPATTCWFRRHINGSSTMLGSVTYFNNSLKSKVFYRVTSRSLPVYARDSVPASTFHIRLLFQSVIFVLDLFFKNWFVLQFWSGLFCFYFCFTYCCHFPALCPCLKIYSVATEWCNIYNLRLNKNGGPKWGLCSTPLAPAIWPKRM